MSKRILVVDDEPDILQIVTTLLQTKGYEVEVAHDGQAGLQAVERQVPDLLICDLMMPVISGLEICRRLKREEKTKDMPIIVMSAAAKDSGKPEEFFRKGLGADDFIAKPFDPLNLLGRVEAVLRMRDYEKETPDEAPAAPGPGPAYSTATKTGFSVEDLASLDPSGIVQAFIESWNNADFDVEFYCLADPLTGNLSEETYVGRRREAQAGEQERTQRVKRVVEMEADETKARVVIEREDTVGRFPKLRKEEYELVRGPRNWQIKMVRPLP